MLVDIINTLFSMTLSFFSIIFNLIFALIAGLIALSKGRNFFGWFIATLIYPFVGFIVMFMPRKYPKFTNNLRNEELFRGLNPVVASIVGLAGIVAGSDGSISQKERDILLKYMISNFNMNPTEFTRYDKVFEYGRNNPTEYAEFARIIRTFYNRRDFSFRVGYLLVLIGEAEGGISTTEEDTILRIFTALGLSNYEYQSIKNGAFNNNYQQRYQNSYYSAGVNSDRKYAEVLGVNENATMAEIKKAYRNLVKEFHPDKVASKGMPDTYQEYAKKRMIEINDAYSYFQKKYA